MLVQWLTFAVMILIQVVVTVWQVSSIRTTLDAQAREIQSLRDWRDDFGPQKMIVDQHSEQLKDHETRVRIIEGKINVRCEADDCPLK